MMARRVDVEPRGETVGPIDHDISAPQELRRVVGRQPCLCRLDTDIRVHVCQHVRTDFRLGRPG